MTVNEFILLLLIFFLIYLLLKKKNQSKNLAPLINRSLNDNSDKKFVLDQLDDQLIVLDKFNLIVYVNNSAINRFGNNLLNKNISSVIRNSNLINTIDLTSNKKITQNVKVEIEYPNYQLYQVYCIPGPTYFYPDPNSVVLFFKDFTEIIKSQKYRTDFVANVSHELRTPLMSIKGSLETILDSAKDDPKAQKEFMKITLDQTERMETLINDLLFLSKIELEEHIRPTAIVNINEIFNQVEANFDLQLKQKNIKLINKLFIPTDVIGDYQKLYTLFSNLIDNSIKYSNQNSQIELKSVIGSNKLIENNFMISVKDQGIGISKNDLPRVTERFYRVTGNKNKNIKGTGLGLALMKHIVTQHNGDYEIISELNKGTEVKIFIPTAL